MATLTKESAAYYASLGIRVVILRDAGREQGKIPRFSQWDQKATDDEEEILELLEKYPNANIGALLGPRSGIIDVEFDTEEGRRTADRLFGTEGQCITPTYTSRRSTHRLFKWDNDFPRIQKLDIGGLEIRLGGGGKATQSVMPPSKHPSGEAYKWVDGLSIYEVDVAEVPEELKLKIINHGGGDDLLAEETLGSSRSPEEWKKLRGPVAEGGRNNSLTALVGSWLGQLGDEAIDDDDEIRRVWYQALGVNQGYRPPLDSKEVESLFTSILKRERAKRANEAIARVTRLTTDAQVAAIASETSGEAPESAGGGKGESGSEKALESDPNGFRLEVIEGSPTIFYLYSPMFARSGGRIELDSASILKFGAVQERALNQARTLLPSALRRRWGGLIQALVDVATYLPPDPELHRPSIIAGAALEFAGDGPGEPVSAIRENGVWSYTGVTKLDDGHVAVSIPQFVSHLRNDGVLPDVKRPEVVEVLRGLGGSMHRNHKRWWHVSIRSLEKLERADISAGSNEGIAKRGGRNPAPSNEDRKTKSAENGRDRADRDALTF